MTSRPKYTQAQIRQIIQAAREEGADSVELPGTSISVRGLHTIQAQQDFDESEAAAYCRCTPDQFKQFVKAGLLPRPNRRRWNKKTMEGARARLDVRPHPAVGSDVYFVGLEHFIKIGWSGSAYTRIAALQTASPFELTLLLSIRGGELEEALIHQLFETSRHRGEWFNKNPALLAYIEWLRARPEL